MRRCGSRSRARCGCFPKLERDLQSRRRRRRGRGRRDAAGRAAGARRGRRSHPAHDRICRDARADASPPSGLLRGKPAQKVWAPKLQWAASALRVGVMGLGVLGRDAARGAGAHRLRRRGLEQHAEVDFRRRVLCGRGRARPLSRAHRCAGLPAAADAGRRAASSTAARSTGWRATASSAARSSSMRAAAGCRSRTTSWRRSTTAPCLPRRSTCSAPSRCRRTAGSGRIRR